jgi:hypothetical protein
MAASANTLQSDLNKQKKQYKDLIRWTKDSGEVNKQLLGFGYVVLFPRGSFVSEIKHLRGGESLLTVRANDPGISSDILNDLGKSFANVKLLSIKAPSGRDEFSTFEFSFQIK